MDVDYKAPGSVSLFDSGWGLYLLRGFLFVVLAVFVLGGYAVTQFHGLRQREAMEIAQVAANIADGEGYVTKSVSPFDAWYLHKLDRGGISGGIPEMHHAPAYPLLLSFMYRITHPAYAVTSDSGIFDAEYKAVVPLGIILTFLCGAVLFFVGLHLFNVRVAGIAAAVYLLSNLTLSSMISGLPLPLLSFAVTMACGFAMRAVFFSAVGGHTLKMILLIAGSGIFSAVAMLTDYTMVAVAAGIAFLLAVQLQRLRWAGVILFAAVASMLVLPWLLHNHQQGGGILGAKPYDALAESNLYPGDSLARSVEPRFNSYRVARALRRKVVGSVADNVSGGRAMAGGLIVCFFVLAVFHRYEKRDVAAIKWFVVGVLVLLLLLMPLIGPSYMVLSALFPIVVLLGVSAFVDYIDREEFFDPGVQLFMVWLLIFISALPAVAQVVKGSEGTYPPYYAPIQSFLCGMLDDNEMLYTDIPWATAWYGRKTSVLVPQNIADMEKITAGMENVGGVYLTSETGGKPIQTENGWRDILYRKVPESFPFREAIELPAAKGGQIFLTDRTRWTAGGSSE